MLAGGDAWPQYPDFPGPISEVGQQPVSAAIADFTGDARLDVVTANTADGTISLLPGGADRPWETARSTSVGADLHQLASADFNGDFPVDPYAAVAADLDNDGDLDLAAVGQGALSLLVGLGDGTFGTSESFWADVWVDAVVAADMNGDGLMDLVTNAPFRGGVTVHLNGAAAVTPPPYVTEHSPDTTVDGPVGSVVVQFSKAIQADSFDPAADAVVTGPGGAIAVTSHTWLTNRELQLDFAVQDAIGDYTLQIGPEITDLSGNALDQDQDGTPGEALDDVYQGSFRIDPLYPQVLGHTPDDVVSQPVAAIRIRFDEPMDTGSFSLVEDVVSFRGTDPIGDVPLAGFNWIDDTTLEFEFSAVSADGKYELVLGSGILDVQGRPLDQDADYTAGEAVEDR